MVGSWPAPLRDGYEGRAHPVVVECEGGGRGLRDGACARSRPPGSTIAGGTPEGAIRVLVGPWAQLRADPAAALIEAGPEESGVYADFEQGREGYELVGLDRASGEVARELRARRRPGRRDPALRRAAGLGRHRRHGCRPCRRPRSCSTGRDLRDHYAVATAGGTETPLPLIR